MASNPPKLSQLGWVYVTGAAFFVTFGAGIAFVLLAGRLSLPNALYYLILLPLGLGAAAFLFGAMRSHAKYTGKSSYGSLELGGPVVACALVVLGGLMANRAASFSLTVRVHGPGGAADLIREGSLTVDLAGVRRTASIGANGEVVFAEVPADLDGGTIRIIPEVPAFELANDAAVTIPESHVIDLALKRRTYTTTVRGVVLDQAGKTVRNAALSFNGGAVSVTSDSAGHFVAVLPLQPGSVIPLTVSIRGHVVYDDNVTVAESPPLRLKVRRPSP
ncbi:MAG: hypothetical protein HOP28_14115 [Gemmatimonadales bacterium]|nr:hypothetical protein [Gemmatimonadales bacterium]